MTTSRLRLDFRPGGSWLPSGPKSFLNAVLWYALPALAVAGVLTYFVLAVAWHANPPVVPVTGTSMRPALHAGDLVFLKGVQPGELREGDVIGFRVPQETREKYGLPATYVHRIVEIQEGDTGFQYRTQGDAVAGPDPFWTFEDNVVGRVVATAPGAGYPILFFRSRQGRIFAAAVVAILLIYVLLGFWDRRQEFQERNALALSAIVDEARQLRDTMIFAAGGARAPPLGVPPVVPSEAPVGPGRMVAITDGPPEPGAVVCSRGCHFLYGARYDPHSGVRVPAGALPPAPVPAPAPGAFDFESLERELHAAVANGEDVRRTMNELVGAIGEYGEHLRSHTDVMRSLAASTGELQQAAVELRELVAAIAQAIAGLGERRDTP